MVYATHVAMQGWGEAVWQSICMKREMGVMAIIVKMSFFRDILTWLLFSLIIIVSFSVGGRFYSWQAGETSASCFSVVGIFVWMAAPVVDTTEFDLAGGNENATIGDPDWNTGWAAARSVRGGLSHAADDRADQLADRNDEHDVLRSQTSRT